MGWRGVLIGVVGVTLLTAIVFFIMFSAYQGSPTGDSKHLGNDTIYNCPHNDWSGHTWEMKMTTHASGERFFYCPVDGAYIGWQSSADPYPIGQEG